MRGKSKLTLEQKNQRFKALLGDENMEHHEVIERNLYRMNVLDEVDEVFHTKEP